MESITAMDLITAGSSILIWEILQQ
jgi:hypothetical protein